MFRSARVKLTLFYLATLFMFSLALTWGLRALAQNELMRQGNAQRGAFHNIGQEYFDPDYQPGNPEQDFARAEDTTREQTQTRLTRETILLNAATLVVGAAVSYWYAGRTLHPIEEAHEKQKRFTSDASHELRTPLASMRLENEVFLRQRHFSEPEAREQIESNLEEVDRLQRLAINLLDLSRYEGAVLTRKPLDVEMVVDAAIKQAEKGGMTVKFVKNVTPQKVLGDRDSLLELLAILIDNALKYGPPKGTIYIGGVQHGHDYRLAVRDEGKGVAAKDMPHIFERLYRADTARSSTISGHGIGLSLAQEIAMANGGRLSAANHPEGGAIFTLTLQPAKK